MLSCTSDRNPCCGPKTAASVAPGSDATRSRMCRKLESIEAGLQTTPTRWPRSAPESTRRSLPSLTAIAPMIARPQPVPGSDPGQTLTDGYLTAGAVGGRLAANEHLARTG